MMGEGEIILEYLSLALFPRWWSYPLVPFPCLLVLSRSMKSSVGQESVNSYRYDLLIAVSFVRLILISIRS